MYIYWTTLLIHNIQELTAIEALLLFSHLHSMNVESTLLGLTIGSMRTDLL